MPFDPGHTDAVQYQKTAKLVRDSTLHSDELIAAAADVLDLFAALVDAGVLGLHLPALDQAGSRVDALDLVLRRRVTVAPDREQLANRVELASHLVELSKASHDVHQRLLRQVARVVLAQPATASTTLMRALAQVADAQAGQPVTETTS
jgi:hypothetical protein